MLHGIPPARYEVGVSTPKPPQRKASAVITPKRVAGLVIVALAVVFVVQNTRRTRVRFIVPIVTTWVWLALVVALILGFALGALVFRRRK
jgi:uncharacterized integral membrane protein